MDAARAPRHDTTLAAAASGVGQSARGARLASVVVHPARLSSEPDAEGFRQVHSRRR